MGQIFHTPLNALISVDDRNRTFFAGSEQVANRPGALSVVNWEVPLLACPAVPIHGSPFH
jgi:hypothetical protein